MVRGNTLGQERQQRHQEIRPLVIAHRWSEAISQFRECVEALGPHIGLLCDWASCYYEAGRYQECWILVERIVTDYSEAQELLSNNSKWRTAVMLAKFYDEMGEPAKALSWLRTGDQLCTEFEDKKWFYLQEIRILSYYGSKSELHKKYLAAIEMHRLDDDLKIETLHALMWTEGLLFGFDHACKRFQQLQQMEMNGIDQRLMARDFLELSALASQFSGDEVTLATTLLSSLELSDFDRLLLGLFSISTESRDIDELQLSDMMKLRLLLLEIKFEKKPELQLQKKRKYLFLVDSFSEESQAYFKRIEPLIAHSEELSLILLPAEKKAYGSSSPDQKLALTGSEIKLLVASRGHQQLGLDEISQLLWQSQGSESLYHRLRMLCYKLNEKLRPVLGFTPFEVKKDGLTVHTNFKLEVRG